MNDSIKISPKHGINPTIPRCFFCGKEKPMIALLGQIDRADSQAPRSCVIDYEPCEECKEKMNQGITLIEVSETPLPDERPEILQDFYPTGRWCVVSEEFLCKHLKENVPLHDIIEKKVAFVEEPTIQLLLLGAKN